VYQSKPPLRERVASIAFVIVVHAALAIALINLSPPIRESLPQDVVEIFDVTEPPPPPPVVEQIPEPQKEQPKREEGAASAKNIESQATQVVAPKPPIQLPIPQPIPVTQTPGQGSDRTQGASDVVGPGTGAGGQGTGTGSGGSGSGTGEGGGGGTAAGVKLVRGITNRDYPPAIQRSWPRGGRIFVRVRVQPDGRVSQCDVMRSFGDKAADQWTCSLVLSRARFRPATDANGRPIAAWFGYVQSDVGRFDR
jgi:protein TonB